MIVNPEVRLLNETIYNGLTSGEGMLKKQAQESVDNYLRLKMREDGIFRKILPPSPVTPADLDRQVDTPKPVIVKDMEPNSGGAYTIPFMTTPMDHYIKGPRYRIMFDRIASARYTADVNNLLTYDMDIRQILNDFLLKDIMYEEDKKFMTVVNYIVSQGYPTLVDTAGHMGANSVNSTLAAAQNINIGAINRQSLSHLKKALPSTNRHLNPAIALVNNITIWDVVGALTRDEAGGDISQDMLLNGFAEKKIMGLDWAVTIKTDLVPDDVIYQFAEPKYTGDFIVLDDITVSTKHEDYILEFFAYECLGATIQNVAAVARATASGSQVSWRTGT